MWKPYGRLFCCCLALLSLFSPVYLRAEVPLTEAEIRAWAADKERPQLTEALVTVAMEAETLNRLLIEERRDLTEYKAAVTTSVSEVRDEINTAMEASQRSVESFERALQQQTSLTTRIERENTGLKIVIGILVTALVYSAVK